jgi:hypothetical protein
MDIPCAPDPTGATKEQRSDAGRSDTLARAAILVAWLLLACLTWGHWGEVARYDTGREMYVPYALVQGKVLYRDLWYTYGPVAPYWNALLFWLFGSRLEVLYASGLAQTLAFALLLYGIARRFLPVGTASLAAGCFLLQAFQCNLFNFVLPYATAATLGALCGVATLYFCVREALAEPGWNLFWGGLAAGLALATKQEFGAAAWGTLAFLLAALAVKDRSGRGMLRAASGCLPGLLLPIVVYGWLAWRFTPRLLFVENLNTPLSYHMRAVAAPWLAQSGLRFGWQDLLGAGFSALGALTIWCLLGLALSHLLASAWGPPVLAAIGAGASLAAWGYHWNPLHTLHQIGIPFLLFPLGMSWVAAALLVISLVRWRRGNGVGPPLAAAVLAVYALGAGARVLFLVLPIHYGVYHAQPLFVAFLVGLTAALQWVNRGAPASGRSTALAVVLALEATGLTATLLPRPGPYSVPLHTSRGTIYARREDGAIYPQLISFIEQQKAQGRKVVVLPQEVSLYFFTATDPPARWYGLQPGVLVSDAREREYLQRLEQYNADYILLSNRDTPEYNLPYFGIDYNPAVLRWIEDHYEEAGEIGRFVRQESAVYGVRIYRRRDPLPGP